MTRVHHIRLDPAAHAIINGDVRTVLQHKVWQVLVALVDTGPQVVSRQLLIDSLWSGKQATGDKGLNQALWTLRKALGDSAAAPRYIRTVPRQGYQWIGPDLNPNLPAMPIATTEAIEPRAHWRWLTLALSAAMLALTLYRTGALSDSSVAMAATGVQSASGTHAWFDGDDIIVDHFRGCRLVLKSNSNKVLSSPLLSVDGEQLAFRVNENAQCRLMLFEFPTRELRRVGACPGQDDVPDLTMDTI